jgi:hypothetical protein
VRREERAERIRHAFRNDPEVRALLEASQADEREGHVVTLEEVILKYPVADD